MNWFGRCLTRWWAKTPEGKADAEARRILEDLAQLAENEGLVEIDQDSRLIAVCPECLKEHEVKENELLG